MRNAIHGSRKQRLLGELCQTFSSCDSSGPTYNATIQERRPAAAEIRTGSPVHPFESLFWNLRCELVCLLVGISFVVPSENTQDLAGDLAGRVEELGV